MLCTALPQCRIYVFRHTSFLSRQTAFLFVSLIRSNSDTQHCRMIPQGHIDAMVLTLCLARTSFAFAASQSPMLTNSSTFLERFNWRRQPRSPACTQLSSPGHRPEYFLNVALYMQYFLIGYFIVRYSSLYISRLRGWGQPWAHWRRKLVPPLDSGTPLCTP